MRVDNIPITTPIPRERESMPGVEELPGMGGEGDGESRGDNRTCIGWYIECIEKGRRGSRDTDSCFFNT